MRLCGALNGSKRLNAAPSSWGSAENESAPYGWRGHCSGGLRSVAGRPGHRERREAFVDSLQVCRLEVDIGKGHFQAGMAHDPLQPERVIPVAYVAQSEGFIHMFNILQEPWPCLFAQLEAQTSISV